MKKNALMMSKECDPFTWERLGDVPNGRGALGEEVPVSLYRLMHYTLLDVLSKAHGEEHAKECFRQAGFLAGVEFAKNLLDLSAEYSAFTAELQRKMREFKIGILRIEDFNEVSGEFVLTVGEDLECSGMPITGETVCFYDEGFIAGIFQSYTGKRYHVREIDCWATGNRVCRFHGVAE